MATDSDVSFNIGIIMLGHEFIEGQSDESLLQLRKVAVTNRT